MSDERARLRLAIEKRTEAATRLCDAEAAATRGRALRDETESQRKFQAEISADCAAQAAEELATTLRGAGDTAVIDDRSVNREKHAAAEARATTTKAAHDVLVADVQAARSALKAAELEVISKVGAIVVLEAERIARELNATQEKIWALHSRLSALGGLYFHGADGSGRPTHLGVSVAVREAMGPLLRERQHALAGDPEMVKAAAAWRRFYGDLQKNPDAEFKAA